MPTMRDAKSLQHYVEISPGNVDFLIISQEKLTRPFDRTIVFYDKEVFAKSWIFNRITKRNFGFLWGFHNDYDIIISLDDDCYPINNNFFRDHFSQLKERECNFFNPLLLYEGLDESIFGEGARGTPRNGSKRTRDVVLNQGLWLGDTDLDASTIISLGSQDGKIPQKYKEGLKITRNIVVPTGQFTTVCGMNVSFKRDVVPFFYQSYMEPEPTGINRYEDIWAGLFLKLILDKIGKSMSLGCPPIFHDKAPRNPQRDLQQEMRGREMNSFLWQELPNLTLASNDGLGCYLEIADWLLRNGSQVDPFLSKIAKAMIEWALLMDKPL
jgi:hypothetical protein